MRFFEKRYQGMVGGQHGGQQRNYSGGHHGLKYGYQSNPGQSSAELPASCPTCPMCGTVSNPGARFCQRYGTSLVSAICANCNVSLAPGATFCPNWGKAPQP